MKLSTKWFGMAPRVAGMKVATAMVATVALLGTTACTLDYTVAYVYTTARGKAGTPGYINAYGVDYATGALITLTGSPFKTGVNPTAIVASPDAKTLYVVNHDDSTVQAYTVGSGGVLTTKGSAVATGSLPTSEAIDTSGKFLLVTFTYQSGFSASKPGPGGVSVFPVGTDGTLGNATTVPVGNNPVAVVASNFNHFVYVVDQEASPRATVLGFAINPSNGALTPVPGTTITTAGGATQATGFPAGVTPSGIAEDPTARFVYITDQSANQLIGYVVQGSGSLVPMVNGPFTTGLFPLGVTIDPRGLYLYVANFNANTVSEYAIDTATGTPSSSGSGGTAVGTGPTAVAIDPALGVYLYTSNNLDGTTSGEKLNPHNGTLGSVQNTPYPGSGQPTAVATIASGTHSTQVVQP